MAGGVAWGLWALTPLALPVVNWLDQRLRQAGLSELAILEPAAFPLAAAALTAATVGTVHYGVMVRPGALPAAS